MKSKPITTNPPVIKLTRGISLPASLYLRDPELTDLGRRMLSGSIELLDRIGFDSFTFKKLAATISSTEASVYRYFSDKSMLMRYLEAWYWAWLDFRLTSRLSGAKNPRDRYKIAVETLVQSGQYDAQFEHIDEVALHRVVVRDARKGYVDVEMRAGKRSAVETAPMSAFHAKISTIVADAAPKYPFPATFALTLVSTAHLASFFRARLAEQPELDPNDSPDQLRTYFASLSKTIGVSIG